jgi:hypothetical protein
MLARESMTVHLLANADIQHSGVGAVVGCKLQPVNKLLVYFYCHVYYTVSTTCLQITSKQIQGYAVLPMGVRYLIVSAWYVVLSQPTVNISVISSPVRCPEHARLASAPGLCCSSFSALSSTSRGPTRRARAAREGCLSTRG